MAPMLPAAIAASLVDPKAYGEWDGLHANFSWARAHMPLAIADVEGHDRFWAVTRHADILEISRNNARFASGIKSPTLTNKAGWEIAKAITPNGDGHLIRSLVQMDAPDHMKYRLLTQNWFMPKNIKTIEGHIRAIARQTVEKMLGMTRSGGVGECDFASDVAAAYPLHVVMNILGVPPEDEPRMLMLTQQLFGPTDPEINRARAAISSPEKAIQMLQFVIADFEAYFSAITADRRANPRDDLATVIANGIVNGAPIPDREANGYYMIVATAGHDTTSASTCGAIMELAKSPALFARYRDGSASSGGLIEEAIRWTTPVQHFLRTATEDCEISGQKIAKDDWMMLCYISGNRDEAVFENPFTFNPDRTPNNQIAFGYGGHVCLGQHLARMEMRILMEELLPRLSRLELAGTPARVESTFVSGLKRLPIRFVAA
jgi:cytochrome P450